MIYNKIDRFNHIMYDKIDHSYYLRVVDVDGEPICEGIGGSFDTPQKAYECYLMQIGKL